MSYIVDTNISQYQTGKRNFRECFQKNAVVPTVCCNILNCNIAEPWKKGTVAPVFVKDGVTASSSIVKAGVLQTFLSLLQHGSDEKEKAIINAIAFRLEEVDLDIPF